MTRPTGVCHIDHADHDSGRWKLFVGGGMAVLFAVGVIIAAILGLVEAAQWIGKTFGGVF